MVAGALSDDEMAAQGMPNPGKNESSKPAANFVFGNYTFQIKAKDENGTVIDGFKFAKPIMITMYFNPAELGSRLAGDNTGRDAAASFTPQLNLFDIETGTWINARDSCPAAQRFESVDYVALKYTVAICHLTQFGLFYQRRPVALAYPLDAPALLVGSDLMPQPMTAADQASIRSSPTAAPQSSLWILGSSTSGGFILDGTSSYDPDGEIASAVWSITAGPQVDALDAELVDGTLTRAAYTAARADLNAQLASLNSVGTRAFVSDSILSSGVYTFGLVVTDGQGSTDAMNTTVVVHSPPVAVMSRSFYPSQALVNAGVAAVIPVSGSEISDAYTWALAEALDDDVIVDATASTFDSTTGSSGVMYQWTIAAASGSGNASLPDIINATSPVALIRNVSGGAYAVSVIITDALNTTGSASVLVGLPLLARIDDSAPIIGDSSFTLDASSTLSSGPLSSLVFLWDVLDAPAGVSLSSIGLAFTGGATLTVSNVTALGFYTFSVLAISPSGATSTAWVRIERAQRPTANFTVSYANVTTGCRPDFQMVLNASSVASSSIVSYTWSSSFVESTVAPTVSTEFNAVAGATIRFQPFDGPADPVGSVVRVAARLDQGIYTIALVITDANGLSSTAASFYLSVGSDGYYANGRPALPVGWVRPPLGYLPCDPFVATPPPPVIVVPFNGTNATNVTSVSNATDASNTTIISNSTLPNNATNITVGDHTSTSTNITNTPPAADASSTAPPIDSTTVIAIVVPVAAVVLAAGVFAYLRMGSRAAANRKLVGGGGKMRFVSPKLLVASESAVVGQCGPQADGSFVIDNAALPHMRGPHAFRAAGALSLSTLDVDSPTSVEIGSGTSLGPAEPMPQTALVSSEPPAHRTTHDSEGSTADVVVQSSNPLVRAAAASGEASTPMRKSQSIKLRKRAVVPGQSEKFSAAPTTAAELHHSQGPALAAAEADDHQPTDAAAPVTFANPLSRTTE